MIYDLVQDGVTSSDGGDGTVARRDPSASAVVALEVAAIHRTMGSFTGPVDPATVGVIPRTLLGATPGTRPDDDFATPAAGAWHWSASQRASGIGQARIAPLIGTIGNGASSNDKTGGTVFVAAGSPTGFGAPPARARNSSPAIAFASGSTSTATMTVTRGTVTGGNLRPRAGNGYSVTAADSLPAMPPADEPAPRALPQIDTVRPSPEYRYAPAATPNAKANPVEASFSNAVTAAGMLTSNDPPATRGGVRTGERLAGRVRPGQSQTRNLAAYIRVIDLTQPVEGSAGGTQIDGTRTFASASVSASPSTAAALYLAKVVGAVPVRPPGLTVEAFQVGPVPGLHVQGGTGTTVSGPLHGRIVAGAGALNSALALP